MPTPRSIPTRQSLLVPQAALLRRIIAMGTAGLPAYQANKFEVEHLLAAAHIKREGKKLVATSYGTAWIYAQPA